ncbi:toxin-antitoxin system, toxin component [Streptomyces sp. NPDC048508]|uniref:toxin-antitoxin system, toxin component n=1 Tax=Streptomyces sp. NPDC048508 TaxID=3365561 RepID=UPI003715B61A
MKVLSAKLVTGLADAHAEIFSSLGPLLSVMRGRPVILKRATFPPDTTSGLWLNLPDMDILAVREDTADTEHEQVILGHEIWHMFQGHCSTHTTTGQVAARGRTAETISQVVQGLVSCGDGRLRGKDPLELQFAARTCFDDDQEVEAEMFGLHFGTELRTTRKSRRRPDLRHVAGRIEDSMGRGPWN